MANPYEYFAVMFLAWSLALFFIKPPVIKVFHGNTNTFVVSYPLLLLYASFLASLTTLIHLLFVAK